MSKAWSIGLEHLSCCYGSGEDGKDDEAEVSEHSGFTDFGAAAIALFSRAAGWKLPHLGMKTVVLPNKPVSSLSEVGPHCTQS